MSAARLISRLALAAALPAALLAAPEIAIEQPAGASLAMNRVVGWGMNNDGQTTIPAGLAGVVAIDAGRNGSLAVKIDGTVVVWGAYAADVIPPGGFANVVSASHAGYNLAALKTDGSIIAAGYAHNPVPISPNLGSLAVSAGLGWSVAIKSDTTAVVWGQNTPTVPAGMNNLAAVAAGDFHVVGLKTDGSVVAWGNNSHNQGIVPAALAGVPCTAVAAGMRHSLVLKSDGSIYAWGFNDNGGGLAVTPPTVTGVVAIAAGGHALALRNNDTITGWGRNFEGQLNTPAGLTKIRAIAAGDYHSLALAGSVVAYGPQPRGIPVVRTFTIKNTGPDPLTISGVNLHGSHAAEFSVNTSGMLTTLPALTGQTTFSVAFNPASRGEKKTFLRVLNNDGDEAVFELLLTGTGLLPGVYVTGNESAIVSGDSTPSAIDHTDLGGLPLDGAASRVGVFTIHNDGPDPLSLGTVTVGGDHAADFSIVQPAASVTGGGSTTFQVVFDPSAAGLRRANIAIPTNVAGRDPYTFAIQGTGIEPAYSVSGPGGGALPDGGAVPFVFPDAQVTNESRSRVFEVFNRSPFTITPGVPFITGANPGDFHIDVFPAATLGVNSYTTLRVVFDPAAPGVRNATLAIPGYASDPAPYLVSLQGVGLSPEVTLRGNGVVIAPGDSTPGSADHTDFGTSGAPSGYLSRTYQITNSGTGTLTLGAITFSGAHATDFVVATPPAATLAVGESTTFRIGFSPLARGSRNATCNLATNVFGQPAITFAVRGSGVVPDIALEGPDGQPFGAGQVAAWGANNLGQLAVPAGLDNVVSLVAGFDHTVALRGDGTVVAWGANTHGQTNVPAGLRGVVKISTGRWHTIALKNDGTLAAWGSNTEGQGNIAGITGATDIAAGDGFVIIRHADGTLSALGSNYFGETSLDPALTDTVALSAGYGHVIALRADGTVRAWGRNYEGESTVPADLDDVVSIIAGFKFSLALRADGTIAAWGENDHDEIGGALSLSSVTALAGGAHGGLAQRTDGALVAWGDGAAGLGAIPAGLSGARAFARGNTHAAAAVGPSLRFDARFTGQSGPPKTITVRNTGADPLTISSASIVGPHAADFILNASGPLATVLAPGGQISFTASFLPSAIGDRFARLRVLSDDPDEGVQELALFGACLPDNEISISGNSADIASGDTTPTLADHTDFGDTAPPSGSVTRTFTISNLGVDDLTLGALSLDGTHASEFVVIPPPAWPIPPGGSATFAISFKPTALGLRSATVNLINDDGDENPFVFAIQGRGIAPEIVVEAGACAELPPTAVVAWGSDYFGQVSTPPSLAGVVAVSAGGYHSLALRNDGTVVAWGYNQYGQASPPPGLNDVIAIAADFQHSLALRADGTVVAWGDLGHRAAQVPPGLSGVVEISTGYFCGAALRHDGTVVVWGDPYYAPISPPAGLTDATAIAAGDTHLLALRADGTVVGWGYNASGQASPPSGLADVVAIAAGASHSLALKRDGSVVAWGLNDFGQTNVPAGLVDVVAIDAGGNHSVALKRDGTVVAWGHGLVGETATPVGLAPAIAISAGGAHTLALTGSLTDFGARPPGDSGEPVAFAIKNTGADPLVIHDVEVVGRDAADFSVNVAGLDSTLPALTGRTNFTVTFTPSSPGPRHATLRVRSNDGDEPLSVFGLAGQGVRLLSPVETWRVTHFGSPANTGTAADTADHDGDGVANLLEYAFGLVPIDPSSAQLPALDASGAALAYDFTEPAGVSDIHYGAEWSTTLEPGSWTAVPDTGAAPRHIFSVPLDGRPRLFLRLVVTPAP